MATLFSPTPGVVYSLHFIDGYTTLDGVYRLSKLMTYDEYLSDGGDMVTSFFEANGKAEIDLENDLANISSDRIMKLVLPDTLADDTAVYAPLSYLEETQDHNVNRYHKFGIVCYVGITDDMDTLEYIKDTISDQVEAATGISPDPKFVSIAEVYLTDAEYQEEEAKRDASKLQVTNYYSEVKRLQTQLSQANTRNKALEELVIALYESTNEEQVGDG